MSRIITRYVCGFVFRRLEGQTIGAPAPKAEVLLMRKARPEWQAGRFNGVGGKCEDPKESATWGMVREFFEEAGVLTAPPDWIHFCDLVGPHHHVHFLAMFTRNDCDMPQLNGRVHKDEELRWCDAYNLPALALQNVRWLVPMALDCSLAQTVTVIDKLTITKPLTPAQISEFAPLPCKKG